MQAPLARTSSAARPAASKSPWVLADKVGRARGLLITRAARVSTARDRGRSSRDAEDDPAQPQPRNRSAEASSGTGDRPAKAKRPSKAPAAQDEGTGIDLDDLLADDAAVNALRETLLASLSAQHADAVREEEEGNAPPASSRQEPEQPQPQRQRRGQARGSAAGEAAAATQNVGSRQRTERGGRGQGPVSADAGTAVREKSRARGPKSSASREDDADDGSAAVSFDAPAVVLKRDKARLFANGNPMVYSGAVDCVIARPPPGIGDAVLVASASRRLLGWGVYNPHSMFRVRLLQLQGEIDADPRAAAVRLDVPGLVAMRVREAAELRRALGLPNQQTNVYRLINSEGDRLSGLVADVLGSTVVVQSLAGWVQRYRSDVEAAIRSATGLSRIVWRPLWSILAEEGLQPPTGPEDAESGQEGEEESEGGKEAAAQAAKQETEAEAAERVEVREAGLRLLASPMGQKTGFYADQRDSRAFLASLVAGQSAAAAAQGAKGPTMLDLCCYSGGFALAALASGASRVVGVDSSEAAISLAKANAELNGLDSVATFVRDDVSDFMKAAVAEGRQFDVVVLDPPKLAPDRNSLGRARSKYLRLNVLAMRLVRPGGLLMTCSCSGAMTQSGEFPDMVLEAARQAGRVPTLLRTAGAAPDHALNPAYPEGEYLVNVTLRLL